VLQDAAAIDEEAEQDPCASGHLGECAVSRSMDRETEATSQSPASVSQQQAAVQEATEAPKVKQSGSRWSKVGKYSTIQVFLPPQALWPFTYGKMGKAAHISSMWRKLEAGSCTLFNGQIAGTTALSAQYMYSSSILPLLACLAPVTNKTPCVSLLKQLSIYTMT